MTEARRIHPRHLLSALGRRFFKAWRQPGPERTLEDDAYRARIELAAALPAFRVAEASIVAVEVTNASPHDWPGDASIAVSYHWRRTDGSIWALEGVRTPLPGALAPGERCRLECSVRAPNTPAVYELELDLVRGERWFHAAGSPTLRRAVEVGGMRPESLADIDYEKVYASIDLNKDYWTVVGPSSVEEFRQLGQAKLRMLQELGLTPASRVLDVGCGTGSLTEALAGFLAPEGAYYGTDVSSVAVEFCRQRYARPNFSFAQNGMTTLPIGDDRFDFIVFFSVFTHTYPAETRELLAEAKRLLGEGGAVLADVFEADLDGEAEGTRAMMVLRRGRVLAIAEELGLEAHTISQFAWEAQGARPIDRVMRRFGRRPSRP